MPKQFRKGRFFYNLMGKFFNQFTNLILALSAGSSGIGYILHFLKRIRPVFDRLFNIAHSYIPAIADDLIHISFHLFSPVC